MLKNILLYFFVFSLITISAQNNENKVMKLVVTDTPIEVDGIIEKVWAQADSVSDFFQSQPFYGQKATRRTVAKLLTTEESLFCLMICYDNEKNINKMKGTLDDFSGDNTSLMIDTFNDQRTAYKFAVSASGVRSDCRLLDDARNRDYSWDGIWFAESKIYPWGYVVEMEIPYKSIQYDETLSDWGLDFDRWIPENTEDIYWSRFEQNEGQRVSKFGKLLFENFRPGVKGLNLEIYPVGISKIALKDNNKYDIDPDIGLDIFYNPSQKLTFQLTANPDFAQIEADPFDFNISRYESYFDERRPFFTEGNEVFMPSGKQRNTGFYRPLELFYSRRIGKKLPDGSEVPLQIGSKAFGRINDMEYGGFVAKTGEKKYKIDDSLRTESGAYFSSLRFKKQIFDNSSVGLLYVAKHIDGNNMGVIDIDGAFRTSKWQLAYQLARSFENEKGDYASAAGFTYFGQKWMTFARTRLIGEDFNVDQVGFVPWRGTKEFVGLSGPRWYFESGYIRQIGFYTGPILYYEQPDRYTDYGALLGFNMQFRNNWGYEINTDAGKAKDSDIYYDWYSVTFSTWFHTSPKWHGNVWGGYKKTYNFSRDYLSFYSWLGTYFEWQAFNELEIGTSADVFIEGDPGYAVEDITYNARPYLSLTPVNDLNVRMYVDNVFVRSSDQMKQIIIGLLFSYNFSPKSWIYFAYNEFRDREQNYKLTLRDQAAVLKLKYLYYF